MREAILNFNKQFEFEPVIENAKKLQLNKFIVGGMGGSHLAADLLKIWRPELDLIIHSDYGLPAISDEELKSRLYIASSYSGNTEEVIEGLTQALAKGMPVLIISVGGKIIETAKAKTLPYILLPNTKIQPRAATGYSFLALLKAMGEEEALKVAQQISKTLDPKKLESQGKEIAEKLHGFVPIIYASAKNTAIAQNWKIKFNENGKIPAFYNVLPELNHNEMTGFDAQGKTRPLSEKFYFIFLEDKSDHPQIQKRMRVLQKLYSDRGLRVQTIDISNEDIFLKIFSSLILGDWASYYAALKYGIDPEPVPMVEEFKKLIA